MRSSESLAARADRSVSSSPTSAAFTAAQRDRLFDAILVDDVVDAETRLPARIGFDYPADTLQACFALCRDLWSTGFDRPMLVAMIAQLLRGRPLDDLQRRRFKAVRAKFKHFRYAYRLYGADHQVPQSFDRVTIVMGKLQDAIRNHQRAATISHALALRLLLSRPFVRRLERDARNVAMTDAASFRRMFEDDAARLTTLIAQPTVSGRELHAGRKIIGRQVSFYDTLRTLAPSQDAYDMSRSLSAINGLMGELHDELIEEKMIDSTAYDSDRFAMPADIARRLAELVAGFGNAVADRADGQSPVVAR